MPARNTLLLSLALGWAEVVGATDIFVGVNAVDYSGYPDCRPEFIEAFEHLAQLATKAGVEGARFKIRAPLSGHDQGRHHPRRRRVGRRLRAHRLLLPGRWRGPGLRKAATPAGCALRALPPPGSWIRLATRERPRRPFNPR